MHGAAGKASVARATTTILVTPSATGLAVRNHASGAFGLGERNRSLTKPPRRMR